MCPNILTAVNNIVDFKMNDLSGYFATYPIRINTVGQQLEYYVKDAICGLFKNETSRNELAHSQGVFSYLGNQNNPPDLIIANGDAFEIKKIISPKANLALNNSPPKNCLRRDDPRITQHCRNVDGGNWSSKEIFYAVGCAKGGKLKYLFFVHGRCYAADKKIYSDKAAKLKNNIQNFFRSEGWEITKTRELGRNNRMDPLGITNFRIRGMWEIENPIRVFSYLYYYNERREFSLIALMLKNKFDSFPKEDKIAIENNTRISVKNVKIKNPNNPAELLDAKLITSGW
jgi:hypothetical protein